MPYDIHDLYEDPATFSPEEVKTARQNLGLNQWALATLLGYLGRQRRQMMQDLETGKKPFREPQRRLLEAYLDGYRPPDWESVAHGPDEKGTMPPAREIDF